MNRYTFVVSLFCIAWCCEPVFACPDGLIGVFVRLCSCCRKGKKPRIRVTPVSHRFEIKPKLKQELAISNKITVIDSDNMFSPLAAWGKISNSISLGRFKDVDPYRSSKPLRVTTAGIASIFDEYKYLIALNKNEKIHINCQGCQKVIPVNYCWSIKKKGHFQKECIETMTAPSCFNYVWDQMSCNQSVNTDVTLIVVVEMPSKLKPTDVVGSNDIASRDLSTFFDIPHPDYDISRFLMKFGADVLGQKGHESWIILRLLLILRFEEKTHAICDCYGSSGDVLSRTIYL